MATIPIYDSFDVVVSNFRASADSDNPINDAVLTATAYDFAGNALPGADAVSLASLGSGGNYRGTLDPTDPLTHGDSVRVEVVASNYSYRVRQWFVAEHRGFE